MGSDRERILVLVKGLGIGGAEKLIAEGARFWDRHRFHYSVAYVLPWKDQLVGSLEDLGVEVRCIGSRRGLRPSAAVRLPRLIRESAVDLVHAHLPTMGILARMVSPVPVVYTEHNLAGSYRFPTRLANRATYRGNRAVIAVSQAVADSVSAYPGPAPRVIPNGVACDAPPGSRHSVREELGLAPDARLVVHVGNIRPGKGHDTLIDAASVLHRRHPYVTVVSIGGEKYPGDLERVQTRAREEGLEDALLFLGRRPDALRFVAAADVFVNPSSVEGLPVAVLEAMALGRPVVATAAGGVPAVIEDGETGILVQPGEPEALGAAIGTLLDDPFLAERLSARSKEVVAAHYGLDAMVRATERLYEEVLA